METVLKDACEHLSWKVACANKVLFDEDKLKNKRIVVSWSGGWDSTALLVYLAYKYGTPDKPVIAHITKCENINKEQQAKEQEGIKILKGIFKEHYKLHIEYSESDLNMGGGTLPGEHLRYSGISQAPLNAFSTFMYHLNKDLVVCYGYIYKDDFWTIKDDFIQAVHYCGRMLGNPNAEVAFPFCNATKEAIKDFLDALNLTEFTWYCEDPNSDGPCGACGSCKRVRDLILKDLIKKKSEDKECELQKIS